MFRLSCVSSSVIMVKNCACVLVEMEGFMDVDTGEFSLVNNNFAADDQPSHGIITYSDYDSDDDNNSQQASQDNPLLQIGKKILTSFSENGLCKTMLY